MGRISAGFFILLVALFTASLLTAPVEAQPFDGWLLSAPGFPTTSGFVEIPHHAALNPTAGFTFEAWLLLNEGSDCRSIAGKNWHETWWIGACKNATDRWELRSYLKGDTSIFNGGILPIGQWTHIAVTWNGAQRRHYVNGELVGSQALAGPLPTNDEPVRIFSDVQYERSPNGSIDEVRLWSVARTQAQLRAWLNERVTAAQAGLVAVWPLSGNANDIIGPHEGAKIGTGVNYFIAAVTSTCGESTDTTLCLNDRFQVSARFRTGPPGSEDLPAMTITCGGPVCESSGIFWFFQNSNWELMVKSLNGCDITHHWWFFTAGLTNQHFRLEVTDVTRGESKIYFNYPGPPAPAITDTMAFATCPP